MRNAYAILGLSFLVVFAGAYVILSKDVHTPTPAGVPLETKLNTMALSLSSPAFEHNGKIPSKFTCDGEGVNPSLEISGVPEGTETLVLVMDDPDIPQAVKDAQGIEKFDHWVVYNLEADTTSISEGTDVGSTGLNSVGKNAYYPPCPPPQYEPTEHRYIFRLYAIRGQLNFIAVPSLDEVEAAAQGSMIEKTELIGRYARVSGE